MDDKPTWWEKFCENVRNLPELKKPTFDFPVYDPSNAFLKGPDDWWLKGLRLGSNPFSFDKHAQTTLNMPTPAPARTSAEILQQLKEEMDKLNSADLSPSSVWCPFVAAPPGEPGSYIEMDIDYPVGIFKLGSDNVPGSIYYTGWADDNDVGPSAKVLLHPMVRNYWHISALEQRTGRTAIARKGYIELVQAAKSPD